MTERLVTNKGQCVACIGCIEESNCKVECGAIDDCLNKLAKYETAEEDGRLVVLPCKVGDVVYQLMVTDFLSGKLVYKIFESKVCRIIVDSYSICFCLETADENKYTSELTNDDFGETIFLTPEEAEQAIENQKKKEDSCK